MRVDARARARALSRLPTRTPQRAHCRSRALPTFCTARRFPSFARLPRLPHPVNPRVLLPSSPSPCLASKLLGLQHREESARVPAPLSSSPSLVSPLSNPWLHRLGLHCTAWFLLLLPLFIVLRFVLCRYLPNSFVYLPDPAIPIPCLMSPSCIIVFLCQLTLHLPWEKRTTLVLLFLILFLRILFSFS